MTFDSEGTRTFYNKFINAMAQILAQYNGKILKNIGDGLASYFPKTSDGTDDNAIKDVLECSLQQMERRQSLSVELTRKELSEISYRVTLDYGEVRVDTRMSESTEFAFTVPLIGRISRKMPTNTVVLGEDFYNKINLIRCMIV